MVMKAIIIITSVAVLIKNMKTIKIIIKINSQKNKVQILIKAENYNSYLNKGADMEKVCKKVNMIQEK